MVEQLLNLSPDRMIVDVEYLTRGTNTTARPGSTIGGDTQANLQGS